MAHQFGIQRTRGRRLVLAAILLATAGGCAPRVDVHGFIPDEEQIGQIKVGVQDRNAVEGVLGSPSSLASFDSQTWYYITRRTETTAFFEPKVLDQRVVEVAFDKDTGRVESLRRYTLADGREIESSDRVTPTRGKELGFVEQILGNVGRFSDRAGGSNPGMPGPTRRR